MNGPFAKTSPTPSSDHADDALRAAVMTMRPGWIAFRGCMLDVGDAAPAPVRYALLHPRVGIALLDVVPGRTTPHAPDHLKRTLDGLAFQADFGCIPPVVYFCIPVRTLSDVGHLLEHEFRRQPVASPPGNAWVAAAQAALSAQPLRPGRQLAVPPGRHAPQRANQAWQQPARRVGGARLLGAFWGLVVLTTGGGALFLQYLGAPEVAQATASLPIAKGETGGPQVAAERVPSSATDAAGPVGADLRYTLLENDQAILELQSRLKGPRPDAAGMAASTVSTDIMLPGAMVERGMSMAIHTQELETDQSLPLPTQEAVVHPADIAQAEATLQQIRADTEVAAKQLADRNAQAERAGHQATAAEQQLAALQQQSEDAQAAGAAAGKQLMDIQAQLSQLEERRSAAEQQLNALQAQADRTQGDRAMVEQQVAAGEAQLAQVIEQQAKMLATQAAAPVEPAPAVLQYVASVVPASAAAMPAASHASVASEAASFAPVPSLPDRAPDPAAAALAEMMIRRGDALLQRGDVSAARLLYDRAASAGSARAATAMGRTFDATVLAGIGAVGLGPDPAMAALWYRRGLDLGDEEARTWLQSLSPAAGRGAIRAERP